MSEEVDSTVLARFVRAARHAAVERLLGRTGVEQSALDRRFARCATWSRLARELHAWRADRNEAARLRFAFRVGLRLRLDARHAMDRIEAMSGQSDASVAGRAASEADISAGLRSNDDPEVRRDLHRALAALGAARATPRRCARAAADRLALRLGFRSGYASLICDTAGLRCRPLRDAARATLAATRAPHFEERRYWWPAAAEPVPAEGVAFLLSRFAPDGGESGAALQDVLSFFIDLARQAGCRTDGLEIDCSERSGKAARPFAGPVSPPWRVVVSIRPVGTLRDVSELLHELGHGLAFAGIDPGRRWEHRLLWHDHVQETFAFLAASLMQEAAFVREALGCAPSDAAETARYARFCETHLIRRHAALSLLMLAGADRHPGFPARYSAFMERQTGIRHPPELAYEAMEPELMSCSYLAAWLASAQALVQLRRAFGARWWESDYAWAQLRACWRTGGGCPGTAFRQLTGGAPSNPRALVARCTGDL